MLSASQWDKLKNTETVDKQVCKTMRKLAREFVDRHPDMRDSKYGSKYHYVREANRWTMFWLEAGGKDNMAYVLAQCRLMRELDTPAVSSRTRSKRN